MTQAGHVERMGDEKLAKRADAQKVEAKRRQGRPKLWWGIVLRDLDRMREELRKRATDRRNWRLQIEGIGDC